MPAREEKSLTEYWNMLSRHDWYHEYSDDQSVWRRGNEYMSRLRQFQNQSPEHRKLFDTFYDHHFPLPGKPRPDIPPRP